jgi:maltose alpha-D-glucosyltransferase/alpha-amylase
MERDRRRIELINSLLLSMPGTPVIYYGDEIGMGDNIHLGDRDGVRTPMQWSSDRNGGFSRADPEQLVLPPVMGSLYGFDAINVEAQSRDSHSLLNWTRRMLATRRAKRAFGRGKIRFLKPNNRKILAYLRELDGESPILCVANLSRAPQAAELDLSEFAGHVPVEMTADSIFPPVGQLSYLLTFPPYGFHWFMLCADGQRPPWSAMPSEQLPEFTTLVLREGATLPTPEHQFVLETEIFTPYLGMRRWFGSKHAKLDGVRLAYSVAMPYAPRETQLLLAEVEATLSGPDGTSHERYLLPLGIAWDNATNSPLPTQLAFARVRRGRNVGHLTDGFALAALPIAMLEAWRQNATVQASEGTIHFLATAQLQALEFEEQPEIRWLAAEQSNSSLVIGDEAVLKLVRRVVPGIHPEAEMSRYLTQLGYANTAPLFGEVVRVDAQGTPHTLAILQGFIENQGDAWNWTLDYLRRVVDELAVAVDVDADGPSTEHLEEAVETYQVLAGAIGKRLGELHVALATPCDDPAFAPEKASAADLQAWTDEAGKMLAGALDVVAHSVEQLEGETRELAQSLLDRRARLLQAVEQLVPPRTTALRLRVHGDFHLGQVLVAQGDAFLIDFEGEPARTLEERRHKTSPLRDVAGLLRSLSYASAAAQPMTESAPQPTADRKLALFERFRGYAQESFLAEYHAATEVLATPLVEPAAEAALLDLFLIEKAAYEIRYEAANRPTWLGLPIRGLAALASRLLGDTGAADDASHPADGSLGFTRDSHE